MALPAELVRYKAVNVWAALKLDIVLAETASVVPPPTVNTVIAPPVLILLKIFPVTLLFEVLDSLATKPATVPALTSFMFEKLLFWY